MFNPMMNVGNQFNNSNLCPFHHRHFFSNFNIHPYSMCKSCSHRICPSNFQFSSPCSMQIKFPFNQSTFRNNISSNNFFNGMNFSFPISQSQFEQQLSMPNEMPRQIAIPVPVPVPVPFPVKVPVSFSVKVAESQPAIFNAPSELQVQHQSYPTNFPIQSSPMRYDIFEPTTINAFVPPNSGSSQIFNNPFFFNSQFASHQFKTQTGLEFNQFNQTIMPTIPLLNSNNSISFANSQPFTYYPALNQIQTYLNQNRQYFNQSSQMIQPNTNQYRYKYIKVPEQFIINNQHKYYHAHNQVVYQPHISPQIVSSQFSPAYQGTNMYPLKPSPTSSLLQHRNEKYPQSSNQVIQDFSPNITSQTIPSYIFPDQQQINYNSVSSAIASSQTQENISNFMINYQPRNEKGQLSNYHQTVQNIDPSQHTRVFKSNASNKVSEYIKKYNELAHAGKNVDFTRRLDLKNNQMVGEFKRLSWLTKPNQNSEQNGDNFDGLKETFGFFNQQ